MIPHKFFLIPNTIDKKLLDDFYPGEDDIIESFIIDDDFIDYIIDSLGENELNNVPCLNPNMNGQPMNGYSRAGNSLFFEESAEKLLKTFKSWKEFLQDKPDEFNSEDGFDEFNKNEIMDNLEKAIDCSKKLLTNKFYIYHSGI